jgi:transposase
MAQMEEASKKRRQRRSYTDEFRAGAVRLVLDEGKTLSRVEKDLDPTASALASWVKQARADRSNGKTGLTTEERAELTQLRRENRTLRLERDIPKKAAVNSTSQSNSEGPTLSRLGHDDGTKAKTCIHADRPGGTLAQVAMWRVGEQHRACVAARARHGAQLPVCRGRNSASHTPASSAFSIVRRARRDLAGPIERSLDSRDRTPAETSAVYGESRDQTKPWR